MAIEMVVLAPVLFAVILLIVAGGRLVSAQGAVDSVSRDAARAASLARSSGDASDAARQSVGATMASVGSCDSPSMAGTSFVAGGQVVVTVTCQVPLSDLGLVGLPGSATIKGQSTAPLDVYRRTG